jgi:hypothetical protein
MPPARRSPQLSSSTNSSYIWGHLSWLPFVHWPARDSDSLHESVDPSRWVRALAAAWTDRDPAPFPVRRHKEDVAGRSATASRSPACTVCIRGGAVPALCGHADRGSAACPQFKTRVGDRKLYPIGSGLLLGFRYQPMLVYVKDTPDLIVPEVRILLAPCQPLGVFLLLNGPLYESLGFTARTDFQVYEAPFQVAGLLKIARLRQCALANDQESRKGWPEGTTAAQLGRQAGKSPRVPFH